MAHIKLGSAKSANSSINYANSRSVERSGLNCDSSYAKAQFEVTRKLYGKNNGIQAHTIIQSFSPGEVTPKQANELGRALAEKVAPGYEVAIFTHADKDHIHNHIIINSVHPDTGKKYQCHGWEGLQEIRHRSNLISAKNGLTIPYLPEEKRIYGENARYSELASIRHSQAEQATIEQGKDSWKDEIRQAIDLERQKADTYEEFKISLEREYGITVKDSGKHIVFTHPDRTDQHDKGRVRGYKLGDDYTKEGIKRGIEREISKNELRRRIEPTDRAISAVQGLVQSHINENRAAEIKRQEAARRKQRAIEEADKRSREPKQDIPRRNNRSNDHLSR